MKPSYEGKSVWITGGGGGLGKAMALGYADLGARVAVSGRRTDKLDETVRQIETNGGSGLAVPCDVSQPEQVESAAKRVLDQFCALDVAVANAAFALKGRVEDLDAEDWRRQFDVNVVGAAMVAKHTLPVLRARKGRLALVGSIASLIPAPEYGVYCASKYALRAMGQTLSVELHGSGVTCTTIYPGYMNTEFIQLYNNGNFDPNKEKITNRFMWSAERSARFCVRAIHRRKREVAFTVLKSLGWLGRHSPGLVHLLITRLGAPGAETLDAH